VLSIEWSGQSSADHRATVLLRDEHALLLDLMGRLHDPAVPAGTSRESMQEEVMDTIDLLGRIEREVLFPALPARYGALVRAFATDHDGMATCVAALRRTGTSVARRNAHGERLELLARENLAAEQTLLYTELERAHPDLNRALYADLVAARNRLCGPPTQAAA
jgi:hypothetical protein